MLPLKGMKVVDLTKVLAGPLCGQYLGEYGAEVIKVEPVGGGDDTRRWLPQTQGESAIFVAVNHNKRSIAIDLKSQEGQEIVHRLVREADIVLQGFGGGTAKKLGVDYETLSALNEALIYCEISGFGRSGPLGNAPGYDVMLQAFSGMLSTMGSSEGGYARASFSPVDIGTAMNALSGVLAAVIERKRTGKGIYLEVSLLDTALGFMTYMAQSYWQTGVDPKPMGTAHPSMVPYQAFDAQDGAIMLGAGNDAQWGRFCAVAGLDALINHPDFATNALRVANHDKVVALLNPVMRSKTVAQWMACLEQVSVPCSPIHTLGQALAHPQVQARAIVSETLHPVLGRVQNIGHPAQFEHQPRAASRPAPLLGEHTHEILHQLGYHAQQIAGLEQHAVVAAAHMK